MKLPPNDTKEKIKRIKRNKIKHLLVQCFSLIYNMIYFPAMVTTCGKCEILDRMLTKPQRITKKYGMKIRIKKKSES